MENKRLMAWNRCYGCGSFEVYIGYGETIEEKKKYYEGLGYYCWLEIKEVDNN